MNYYMFHFILQYNQFNFTYQNRETKKPFISKYYRVGFTIIITLIMYMHTYGVLKTIFGFRSESQPAVLLQNCISGVISGQKRKWTLEWTEQSPERNIQTMAYCLASGFIFKKVQNVLYFSVLLENMHLQRRS